MAEKIIWSFFILVLTFSNTTSEMMSSYTPQTVVFANNASCGSYSLIQLHNNSEVTEYCKYPALFSTKTNSCEPFDKVDCGNRTEPITPCDYPNMNCTRRNGNTSLCTCEGDLKVNYDLCLTLPDDSYVWPGRRWSPFFIQCTSQRTIPTQCYGPSAIYNFFQNTCDMVYEVVNKAYSLSLTLEIPKSLYHLISHRPTQFTHQSTSIITRTEPPRPPISEIEPTPIVETTEIKASPSVTAAHFTPIHSGDGLETKAVMLHTTSPMDSLDFLNSAGTKSFIFTDTSELSVRQLASQVSEQSYIHEVKSSFMISPSSVVNPQLSQISTEGNRKVAENTRMTTNPISGFSSETRVTFASINILSQNVLFTNFISEISELQPTPFSATKTYMLSMNESMNSELLLSVRRSDSAFSDSTDLAISGKPLQTIYTVKSLHVAPTIPAPFSSHITSEDSRNRPFSSFAISTPSSETKVSSLPMYMATKTTFGPTTPKSLLLSSSSTSLPAFSSPASSTGETVLFYSSSTTNQVTSVSEFLGSANVKSTIEKSEYSTEERLETNFFEAASKQNSVVQNSLSGGLLMSEIQVTQPIRYSTELLLTSSRADTFSSTKNVSQSASETSSDILRSSFTESMTFSAVHSKENFSSSYKISQLVENVFGSSDILPSTLFVSSSVSGLKSLPSTLSMVLSSPITSALASSLLTTALPSPLKPLPLSPSQSTLLISSTSILPSKSLSKSKTTDMSKLQAQYISPSFSALTPVLASISESPPSSLSTLPPSRSHTLLVQTMTSKSTSALLSVVQSDFSIQVHSTSTTSSSSTMSTTSQNAPILSTSEVSVSPASDVKSAPLATLPSVYFTDSYSSLDSISLSSSTKSETTNSFDSTEVSSFANIKTKHTSAITHLSSQQSSAMSSSQTQSFKYSSLSGQTAQVNENESLMASEFGPSDSFSPSVTAYEKLFTENLHLTTSLIPDTLPLYTEPLTSVYNTESALPTDASRMISTNSAWSSEEISSLIRPSQAIVDGSSISTSVIDLSKGLSTHTVQSKLPANTKSDRESSELKKNKLTSIAVGVGVGGGVVLITIVFVVVIVILRKRKKRGRRDFFQIRLPPELFMARSL